MPLLALITLVVALAGGTWAIAAAVHRRRTPLELRGDWWTSFEREFRAYARQSTRQAGDRDRRPDRERRIDRERGLDRDRRGHRGERA